MPDTENLNSVRDFALGNLLIDLAQVNLNDTGIPVDDEELAVFLQPGGKQILGEKRCQQILAWLCRDQLLYQRWLMLSQTLMPETEFSTHIPPSTSAPRAQRAGQDGVKSWWDWLSGLFDQGLGLAPVLGVVAVSVVATYLLVRPEQGHRLAVHQGEALPERASQGSVELPGNPLTFNTSDFLKCAELEHGDSICVSTTPEYQNWFVTHNAKLKAVPPPMQADKITSLYARDNKLLVEYSSEKAFKLMLAQVALTDSGWQLKHLHEDSVLNGYFEQIELAPDALSYDKVKPGTQTETIRYVYEHSDHKAQ